MHRLNGLEKYKKQEQTDFYHNNSGYDSNKSSLFPKHSHYHNNDSLGRTQMNVLSYLGNSLAMQPLIPGNYHVIEDYCCMDLLS